MKQLIKKSIEVETNELIVSFGDKSIDYDKIKKAYPNNDSYQDIKGQHDSKKWLQAVKDIYYKEKDGIDRIKAIRQVTSGWNVVETFDFLNWLKFYEEGAHLKYKYAQLWYENGAPGYFLHIKKDQPEASQTSHQDVDNAIDEASTQMSIAEKKRVIEYQRNKIIGRLDSAEKLLRSEEGQMFAGRELESLMETIYNLKKKIQLVNKLSVSSKLYEDMIVREANSLNKHGFSDAAEMLYAMAQAPSATSPAPPMQPGGVAGGLPAAIPGVDAKNNNSPQLAPKKEKPKGINDFLEKLDTSGLTINDDQDLIDDLEVFDGNEIIVEAQEVKDIPKTNLTTDVKPKESADEENETTSSQVETSFDRRVNDAFSNITVTDVVVKLEDLAKIFKTREVPRQLALIDMMLNSSNLQLSSYFPQLAEATNKSLESNNYIATRVEDVLSKLRGSMSTKNIDLKGGDSKETSPEIKNIKQNLEQDVSKEKARKEMRKEQEFSDMGDKETPEVEIEQDLSPKVKAPIPPQAKPVVAPI